MDAGPGDDDVRANDGVAGDLVVCGPGNDKATVDTGDIAGADCETVTQAAPESGDT
jgi:hypothetical protein